MEQIAFDLADWLAEQGIEEVACIYGCSMGGSVVLRFLADARVPVRSAAIDGGITPYQLPWVVTRLIAVRDFLLIGAGKLGGLGLLEKAFATGEYTRDELAYIEDVLKMMSAKTIWRTFESCNNYRMPAQVHTRCERMEYWYADAEEKARSWDLSYIRRRFPQATFKVFEDVGHGGLALLAPTTFAQEIERMCGAEAL